MSGSNAPGGPDELPRSSQAGPSAHTLAAGAVPSPSARLHLITLGALGAAIALILVGNGVYRYGGSLFGFGESPAVRVSLMGRDLPPGMTQCPVSGRPEGKGAFPYGAIDVWTVVYADHCGAAPSPRYALSWVLEYSSEAAAVAGYESLVGSQVCTIAHGCLDGLGQNSSVTCGTSKGPGQAGPGSCLGTWQRKTFVLTFDGMMGTDEARDAIFSIDARAQA